MKSIRDYTWDFVSFLSHLNRTAVFLLRDVRGVSVGDHQHDPPDPELRLHRAH